MLHYDTPVIQAINKITDLALLGLLHFFLSLTVICAGPASAALYYAVAKAVRRNRGSAFKAFFHSFRENFRTACLSGIVFLIFYAVLMIYDLPRILALFVPEAQITTVQSILSLLKAVAVCAVTVYFFPLISRYNVSVKGAFLTSLALALQHLPSTAILVCNIFAAVFLILVFPWTVLVLPGFVCYLNTYLLESILRAFLPEDNGHGEDPWYLE